MRWTPSTTDDRATTPVIAVVLGIVVTVALAAVVGTYAMNFGDETDATPQASVEFAEDGKDVTVTVQSVQRADRIEIAGDCGTATIDAEAGESATVTCSDPRDTAMVRATYQDQSALLVEYEGCRQLDPAGDPAGGTSPGRTSGSDVHVEASRPA